LKAKVKLKDRIILHSVRGQKGTERYRVLV